MGQGSNQLFEPSFVEAYDFLFAFDYDGPLQQVLVPQHQLNGFFLRGRLVFHVFFPIEGGARVEKIANRIFADDLTKFFFR